MIEAALVVFGFLVFALALYYLVAFEQDVSIRIRVLEQRVLVLEKKVNCE